MRPAPHQQQQQQRQRQPHRVYISRTIWDEARKEGAPRSAYIRAILYELQPFRINADTLSSISEPITWFGTIVIPQLLQFGCRTMKQWTRKEWILVLGVLLYWQFIRFLHRTLDAGPIALIVSALIGIFTIGLGDHKNKDGTSAYSVFNRGFQRLLGEIDVENLVAQHVGGALAMQVQQQQQQQQQQQLNNNNIQEEQVDQDMGLPEENHHDLNEDNHNHLGHQQQQTNDKNRQSRKSGKKARRQNQERRKELQRQRDAAAALGFVGEGEEEDFQALQRLH